MGGGLIPMPRPTAQELEQINRFAMRPLKEDEVYVFTPLIIDDQETAYHSVLHENFLNKIMQDANRGVALLMNHNSRQLPVGRSFYAELRHEDEDGKIVKSVYSKFYIDLGRNTQGGMTTDDIVRGIDAGTIFDVSIGFNASSWKCSICGNDIRDWKNCEHIPGEKYVVNRDGEDKVEKCVVIVGEDAQGELLETSLVYAGACSRATIKQNFSQDSVRDFNKGTKLLLVDNFKNIPLDATIYQFYTRDGSVLFTDTEERTNGYEYLKKRSEETVELQKILDVLNKAGYSFETEDQLAEKLAELSKNASETAELLQAKTDELAKVNEELTAKNEEIASLKSELASVKETNEQLTKANEELSAKAELATTFKQDLIKETIEAGIRAQGNAFNAELFEKFLNTLSVDEIKSAKASFESEAEAKFGGFRHSKPNAEKMSNEYVPDKDEEPEAFSAFIAKKAEEYAKENNVSIKDATLFVVKKYSKTEESEE